MTPIPYGICVSCQAAKGEPFFNDLAMKPLILDVMRAGVPCIRLNGSNKIRTVHEFSPDIPIIGLAKKTIEGVVRITPYIRYLHEIWKAGATWVAVEAVMKNLNLYPGLKEAIQDEKIPCVADISTLDEAIRAEDYGFVAVTTALSGYRHCEFEAKPFDPPDIHLVERCVEKVKIPVIAEGRYHDRKDVKRAFNAGARAVCIGSAITRPRLITEFYMDFDKEII